MSDKCQLCGHIYRDHVDYFNHKESCDKGKDNQIKQLKQQLEEAVEVINQMISDTPHYEDCNSEDPDDIEGCDCGREIDLKCARQFLAKYRGEK